MNEQVKKLEERIISLEKQLSVLSNSNTIPATLDQALRGRGFLKTSRPDYPDSDFSYITNVGFRQDINLSGIPETITVPQFPFRFLKLSDGSDMYIPLHVYADLQ